MKELRRNFSNIFFLIISIPLFIGFSSLKAQLAGTYTIGNGGDYTTLGAAANDLMNQGVSGPVTMNILSGTYTEHFVLNTITGTSAVNTVTFQSAANNADSVLITYNASGVDSNYVVKLDNVQHLTFRYLSFHGSGLSYSRSFDIYATTMQTNNISITSNIFYGDSLSGNNARRAVIHSDEQNLANISILNNSFFGGSSGIYLEGLNNNYMEGTAIISNTFRSMVHDGIYVHWQDSPVIENNNIESDTYGIRAAYGVGNIQILNNRIQSRFYGISGGHFDASSGPRSLIANNFVSVDGPYGIVIGNSINMDVFNNSVNVISTSPDAYAFELGSNSLVPVINILNNSFACLDAGFAFRIPTEEAVDICDYNNFYTAGNYLALWGTEIIDLQNLKNASGKNLNSISVFPNYISDTDLHTFAPWLDNKGTNVPNIFNDIDGEPRDPATPDIGADEFSSNPNSTPYAQDLTVGFGGDFTSLNHALDSLLLRGVSDSIHINIMPGTFVEQVDMISIPGSNEQRMVTFQSQTADTAELLYNSSNINSNYTLRFKGADHIRLRNLKITATGTNYSRVVDLYRGANNAIIENCLLTGLTGSGGQNEKAIIYSADSYYKKRLIRNNKINRGSFGLLMERFDANDQHPLNPVITNNEIVNNGYCGIYLHWTDSLTIENNIIEAENTGIFLNSCEKQSSISKNKIDVNYQFGIRVNSFSSVPSQSLSIVNNFVHVGGPGAADGIYLNGSNSVNIIHNSVNITSTDISNGRALHLTSNNVSDITLLNNIFKNTGGGYAYYVGSPSAIANSNHNDLYTIGSVVAYWNGDRAGLFDLQLVSGFDLLSLQADPFFVSNTDLHTTAAALDSGALFYNVLDDIDNQLRDPDYPDIGADEFGFFPNRAPLITSSPTIVTQVDSLYEYQVEATDPDGDILTFLLTNAPNFLSIDSTSGLISGTAALGDTGGYVIEIEVHDGRGGYDAQDYILIVIAMPQFTIAPISTSLESVNASSVAWGDYDNDGDLDVLLTGSSSGGLISRIYRNDNGLFTDINAGLPGVRWGSTDWGDFDNDGDLDLLITGSIATAHTRISKIYRNDSGVFTDINAGLIGVSGSATWGDYDNDGDLDIFITGSNTDFGIITKIYCNNSGVFTDINATLPEFFGADGAWGDYDNDGDLDLLMTGLWAPSLYYYTVLYRNDSGVFNEISFLTPRGGSSIDWGDYDSDGDLDFLISGQDRHGSNITRIYSNLSGDFVGHTNLTGVKSASASWGDYDNDGDLDILMCGATEPSPPYNPISRIYRNDSGIFNNINAGLWGINSGDAAWGDYDNDGDLDIFITGQDASYNHITLIYQNNINNPNSQPTAPNNLFWRFHNDSELILNWNASDDPETPQAGLTYNLRIGTTPGGSEIKSAMSGSNGYRQVPKMGNTNHLSLWKLNYIPSNIFWSAQAVDHGFLGSPFSVEDTMSLSGIIDNITDVPNDQGSRVTIRWRASDLDNNVNSLQFYSIWRALPLTEQITDNQIAEEKEKSLLSKKNNRLAELKSAMYYWEWIADQPAHRLPYYSYTCETLYDSMSTINGRHYFMISAHSDDPNVFFDSNPDSGYSVDNIAPAAPANLNAFYNNNQITLRWSPNSENDLREYVIYRSISADINPATDTSYATSSDTSFTDTDILPAGNIYYVVCAKDVHDNISSASNEVAILITGILTDGSGIPESYALYQNFPNPFNPYTVIKFGLPQRSDVLISIFNSLGEKVATLVNDTLSPGKYQYIWVPQNRASGLYFYTLQAGEFVKTRKMLLIK